MNLSRYLHLAAVLAILASFTGPAQADDYDDAVRYLKQGNTAAALRKADAAIAADKNDARARFLKGLILTEQNNTSAAIGIFTELTRDYPELPEPYNNLAVLYAAEGQYDKARESLEMAIRTHPSYAVAHENLGDVYAKMASEAYDKALSLDRSNQTAQTKLSLIRELFSGTKALAPTQTAAAEKPQSKETPPAPKPAPAPPAAEAKPAPAKETETSQPPARVEDRKPQVLALVNNWVQAWSNQDVDTYLTHYAESFETPDNLSRADWEKQRRVRLTRPKSINITISETSVAFDGEKTASVRFKQHYKSDTIDSTGYKTLTLTKSDDGWLIIKEQFEN